jgi:hypothetical protein
MSVRAGASLSPAQREQLAAGQSEPVSAPVPLIEQLGGGSVRCMVAEVPLSVATHTP